MQSIPLNRQRRRLGASSRLLRQRTGPLRFGSFACACIPICFKNVRFGAVVDNRRSLVALGNLVDLIVIATRHPSAANQTILVSDGSDVSTAQLLIKASHAIGKQARLVVVPVWALRSAAALVGKRDLAQQLCGSLQIDISPTRSLLNWNPPIAFDDAIRDAAQHFLNELPKLDSVPRTR